MPKPIKIFAIDPGPTRSAYTILEDGRVIDAAKYANYDFDDVFAWVHSEVSRGQDVRAYCEMIELHNGKMRKKDLADTLVMIGRFQEHCRFLNIELILIPRTAVKKHYGLTFPRKSMFPLGNGESLILKRKEWNKSKRYQARIKAEYPQLDLECMFPNADTQIRHILISRFGDSIDKILNADTWQSTALAVMMYDMIVAGEEEQNQ